MIWGLTISSPQPEERKQKKEEQQRFACLDVSKLDDLVEEAQAKTTKYGTKYALNVFQGNFYIQSRQKNSQNQILFFFNAQ